jgi:membrane protein required for colicin V production
MNGLDITILCLVGVGLIKGLFDGVIKQVVALGALLIGIYLCAGVAEWMDHYLSRLGWFSPQTTVIVSYFLGFVLIAGVILIAGHIIHKLISVTPLGIFNHLVGGLLGVVLMILFISFLFNAVELFDHRSVLLSQELKVESRFYYTIKNVIPEFFPGNLFELKK